MAGFYIEHKLRPCLITLYDYNQRSLRYVAKEKKQKALFHCWNHMSDVIPPSPLKGGHPGGSVSDIRGIVEFEDGTVHCVCATDIQFVDSRFDEYSFGYEEEKH